jgi:hypothetical protein
MLTQNYLRTQAKKRNRDSFEPIIITIGETWMAKIETLQKNHILALLCCGPGK